MNAARDIHMALRRLLARPGYTALSVAVLGVGLGTVLFLFSLIDGLLLQPLPFPHADRLVAVTYRGDWNLGNADVRALRRRLHGLEAVGAYVDGRATVGRGAAGRTVDMARLTPSMFALLGVHPLLGHAFTAADAVDGAALHVLIGHDMWQHRFHGDRGVLGRRIHVNGREATIIGVMPPGFAFPYRARMWLPAPLGERSGLWVKMVARLAPGVSLASARAQMRAVTRGQGRLLQGQRDGRHLHMTRLSRLFVAQDLRAQIWMMFAAGLLVLLLACTNVANLQVVQTMNRRRELALRTALGARPRRLLAAPLAESLLLSVLASGVALLMVDAGNGWFNGMLRDAVIDEPYYMHFDLNARLLAFAALVVLATTALAGLLPAWRAARTDAQAVLRDGAKGSRDAGFVRTTAVMVVVEVALTVVLLVGAGTFVQALGSLQPQQANGVVQPQRVLQEWVSMPGHHWDDAGARRQFLRTVVTRIRAQPGVIDATVTHAVPDASGETVEVVAQGHGRPAGGYQAVQTGSADIHYARTFHLRMIRGRFFNAADRDGRRRVAVIDRALAQRLWPHRGALGRRLVVAPGSAHPRTVTVVGVSAPLRLSRTIDPQRPALLTPIWLTPPRGAFLVVRLHAAPAAFVHRLNALVHRIDDDTPLFDAFTQARAITLGEIGVVIFTHIFAVIGAISLLLAAAGLYGFLAYSVEQRTRDIGIRRAIGASAVAVTRDVARQLVMELGAGLLIGLGLGVPWSYLLANPQTHTHGGVSWVFALVVLGVLGVAALAAAVPLHRALRVDPAVALRYE